MMTSFYYTLYTALDVILTVYNTSILERYSHGYPEIKQCNTSNSKSTFVFTILRYQSTVRARGVLIMKLLYKCTLSI